MKTHIRLLAFLFSILLLLATTVFAEPGKISTDNGGTLNMRKGPDAKAKIVTRIKNGSIVDILESSSDVPEGWLHISYGGKEGFVLRQYVKVVSSAIGQEIYSNGNTLYLRESPDEDVAIVGMLNAQQRMSLEEIDEHWALVSNNSVKGYVRIEQIDNLNDQPVAVATQKWEEGVLQKETNLYKSPDKSSEIVSTQYKGIGVAISQYNNKWCLVQVLDENIIGFAPISVLTLTPQEKNTTKVDDSKFTVSASGAKKTAEKVLKQYPGFKASNYTCLQETMYSCDGIPFPVQQTLQHLWDLWPATKPSCRRFPQVSVCPCCRSHKTAIHGIKPSTMAFLDSLTETILTCNPIHFPAIEALVSMAFQRFRTSEAKHQIQPVFAVNVEGFREYHSLRS